MTKAGSAYLGLCAVVCAQNSVVTYHNDNGRTGAYRYESLLTPTNVKAGLFGKRFSLPVDGGVYAQPLYLPRVNVVGKGFHDVLFVATSHDSVYAFDADDESTTGTQPLWHVNFLDSSKGVTTPTATDVSCPVIPELGISGTPVIDPVAGTLYAVAETKEAGNQYVFRLHALDVTSGMERTGSPVVIQPPGFVAQLHKQRTALLLANGIVYSSWSGHCDAGTYHGWLMAHDATTLNLVDAFNTTPGDSGASFWNGGAGPAADGDGNVYVVTANGDFDGDIAAAHYDESVLKFGPGPRLSVSDLFTPYNRNALDAADLDLGSSGAVVLPDEAGSAAHPHLVLTSGKEGRIYLLDRANLGGAQIWSDAGAVASLPVMNQETFGSAAYFNGRVYVGPQSTPLLAFPIAKGVLGTSPSAQSASVLGTVGATPSVSANGTQNGIVWTLSDAGGGSLVAYDAGTLAELYTSSVGGYLEFTVPTVADGKVFASAGNSVAVYGELAKATPEIQGVVNAASYSAEALSPGSLFSIFGSRLAPQTAGALSSPLPLTMADVSVTVNGVQAPLVYVSADQINAQIPMAAGLGPASVVVRVAGSESTPATVTIRSAAPGIFTSVDNQAAALNEDGSVNEPTNPAAAGSVVSVFFTGTGDADPLLEDGVAAPATTAAVLTSGVAATIGGMPAQIQFAGLAPGFVGLAQVNLKVPAVGHGAFPVVVNLGGSASNSGNISVQ